VLLHGFPQSRYSWRAQLPALGHAGYFAVAPDQRGYGQTDAPPDVAPHTVRAYLGDAVGLLDALGARDPSFAARVLAGLPQPFTTSQARQAWGTSRRVAVPLAEWLDARGITRRLPAGRGPRCGRSASGS